LFYDHFVPDTKGKIDLDDFNNINFKTMIKTLSISILFFLTSLVALAQEEITATLVYEGVEDEVYYFSSEEDFTTYSFPNISEEASKKYALTDRKLVGKIFKVTYTFEELLNEDSEPYQVLTLKDITLIEKK
jgi:hypothetical protein